MVPPVPGLKGLFSWCCYEYSAHNKLQLLEALFDLAETMADLLYSCYTLITVQPKILTT